MSDDQDVQKQATRRMDTVADRREDEEVAVEGWELGDDSGSEASRSVRVREDGAEHPTVREVPVNASPQKPEEETPTDETAVSAHRRQASEKETVRHVAVGVSGGDTDDEKTAMLDRDELMRRAARDQERGQNRQDKETVRMKTPFSDRGERSEISPSEDAAPADKTHEMELSEKTTRPVVRADYGQDPIDGTDEFARHGISTVEDEDKVTFPARIDSDLRIVVPPGVAMETDVEPGDLVVVKLRKVD